MNGVLVLYFTIYHNLTDVFDLVIFYPYEEYVKKIQDYYLDD